MTHLLPYKFVWFCKDWLGRTLILICYQSLSIGSWVARRLYPRTKSNRWLNVRGVLERSQIPH